MRISETTDTHRKLLPLVKHLAIEVGVIPANVSKLEVRIPLTECYAIMKARTFDETLSLLDCLHKAILPVSGVRPIAVWSTPYPQNPDADVIFYVQNATELSRKLQSIIGLLGDPQHI